MLKDLFLRFVASCFLSLSSMYKDTDNKEKPLDLKRHQRHQKKTPWRLLTKAVVILVLFYLVKLGIDSVIDHQAKAKVKAQEDTEVEVVIEE